MWPLPASTYRKVRLTFLSVPKLVAPTTGSLETCFTPRVLLSPLFSSPEPLLPREVLPVLLPVPPGKRLGEESLPPAGREIPPLGNELLSLPGPVVAPLSLLRRASNMPTRITKTAPIISSLRLFIYFLQIIL